MSIWLRLRAMPFPGLSRQSGSTGPRKGARGIPARSPDDMTIVSVTGNGPCRPRRRRGFAADVELCSQGLLDQEIVLGQLGALHLFAHPDRQHAAAGPLEALVLA